MKSPAGKCPHVYSLRDDFVPTLACCGPERVPVGRINKFRAIFGQVFPSLAEAHKCGDVCFAMAKWVLAINSAFPTQRNSTVSSHTATKEMSVKSWPHPWRQPFEEWSCSRTFS